MVLMDDSAVSPSRTMGRDSVSWKVNSERVILLGWGPGILMQLAHPLVAAGIAAHSTFATDLRGYLRRLNHTVEAVLALTFGTPEETQRAADAINAIHDFVHGSMDAPAGAFAAFTPYSAHDPALMRWVHATMLDVLPRAYELYVGPLTPEERERFYEEAGGITSLLSIPDGYLPASTAELRDYMERIQAGGTIAVTPAARELARTVLHPPLPWPARPLVWLVALQTIGLLAPCIREAYGYRWDRRHEAALRMIGWIVRHLLPLTPPILRYWPAARRAIRREAQAGQGRR